MNPNIWKFWCRLCGIGGTELNDDINLHLFKILQKHFEMDLTLTDYKICRDCYKFIEEIEQFSKKLMRVNLMFSELECTEKLEYKIDLNSIQEKYKIFHIDTKGDTTIEQKNVLTQFENEINEFQLSLLNDDVDINKSKLSNESESMLSFDDIKDEIDSDGDDDDDDDAKSEIEAVDIKTENDKPKNIKIIKRPKRIRKVTENDDFAPKTCEVCKKVFLKLRSYKMHMRSAHKVDRSCKVCFKDFKNITKLRLHENTHLPPEEKTYYKCDYCDKKYTAPAQVKEHVEARHLCICRTCKQKLPTYKELRLHIRIEHSRNLPPCKTCGKVFDTNQKLKNHEKTHIPLEEREQISCTDSKCKKKFTTPNALRIHIQSIHIGERNFICDNCGKGFTNKYSLEIHLETHKNEVHTCQICQKDFKHKIALRKHQRTHSTKKYPCQICGAILKTPKTLRNHLVVHSDEKNFKCTYCGKLFNRDKNLRVHMIIHTNLKPYQCPFCSQSYANRSNCKKHQKQSHPVQFSQLQAQGIQQPAAITVPSTEQLKTMCLQMKQNENCDANALKMELATN